MSRHSKTVDMSTARGSRLKGWKTIDPEKLELQDIRERQRRIKPGECLKYIRILIDPESLSEEHGATILQKLVELGITYKIQANLVPRTIRWERSDSQKLFSKGETLALSEKWILEPHIVTILGSEEVAEAIKNKSMNDKVLALKAVHPDSNVTLLIYGLKKYCRDGPIKLKRYDIEKCLTEIQILYNCSHRLVETSMELASAIGQFSKAIAEIPFKKQQAEKYSDANLYLSNDNKDCVRVEGSAGFSRLWQQHLTRLPLVTLETAESIMAKYPTPKHLVEEYETTSDGKELLSDLRVRRAGGPLTTDRRIGIELSRKIHTLYTSTDPTEKL